MNRAKLIAATAVAALGLTACNERGASGGGTSRICTPFAEAANAQGVSTPAPGAPGAAPIATDPASALDDCLHRWGYALAASADPADQAAQASVAACVPYIARWNQQGLTAGGPGGAAPSGTETAPSLLTGQPTNPMAEHYNYAHGRALFYVVQARAGKCAAPRTMPGAAARP